MKIRTVFCTDIGRRRQQNQDNGLAWEAHQLCLVADGMGGHKGGETASRIVVETFSSVLPQAAGSTEERLQNCLLEAHRRIYELSQKNETLTGMGTTTTCLGIDAAASPARATIVHVGDSRCYFIRPDGIWQVTRDHSLVQEKVRAGLIRRDQVKLDQMRNVITRSVGFEAQIQIDTYSMEVGKGDLFLLCSDGLTGQLEDLEILDITRKHRGRADWEACARELIGLANTRGGDDNISVGLLEISGT